MAFQHVEDRISRALDYLYRQRSTSSSNTSSSSSSNTSSSSTSSTSNTSSSSSTSTSSGVTTFFEDIRDNTEEPAENLNLQNDGNRENSVAAVVDCADDDARLECEGKVDSAHHQQQTQIGEVTSLVVVGGVAANLELRRHVACRTSHY